MNHMGAGAIVLAQIGDGRDCSWEKEVFPQLIRDGQLYAHPTSVRFYDMGSLSGLHRIQEVLR